MSLQSIKKITISEQIEHPEYKGLTAFFSTKEIDYNKNPLHSTILETSTAKKKSKTVDFVVFEGSEYVIPLNSIITKKLQRNKKLEEFNEKFNNNEFEIKKKDIYDIIYSPDKYQSDNECILYLIYEKKIIASCRSIIRYGHDNQIEIFIAFVSVHPEYFRKKLCTLLIKKLIEYVRKYLQINPNYKLSNVGGIAGCKCYIRGFSESGFTIYDDKKNVLTLKSCEAEDPDFDMFFVSEKQNGGYLYYCNKYKQNKMIYLSMVN